MTTPPPIRTPNELYAHALAIEREAAERYAELAQRMDDLGNDEVAALFRRLAVYEAEHLDTLERRTTGVDVPVIPPGRYAWLDAAAPETVARELSSGSSRRATRSASRSKPSAARSSSSPR
jgi:rubrerythrin